MGKDEYIEFRNGTKMKIVSSNTPSTGKGYTPLHSPDFFFNEVTFINSNMINELRDRISVSENKGLEYYFLEGLKRKSIVVAHHNLEIFVKEKCRCEDNLDLKHRTYFVNNTPFLLHKYITKVGPIITDNGKISIKANFGDFIYL
ncbi:hypothetical protein G1K66_08505 [Tenacibaculum finnmarkense]|uniref:hypothetical protein n=1 Tax=Tenacibaculum finnmarkense TaxID=2781243 RepID=UPI001EFB0370|nr:hypothetical protein [Tenacibaculum finnmarkense]MCG8813301.1 hypothetical protein [Tenacibaculum finnmarkense]